MTTSDKTTTRYQFDITTVGKMTDLQLEELNKLVDDHLAKNNIDCPRGFDMWNVEEQD